MEDRRAQNVQMAADISYMRGLLEGHVNTTDAKFEAVSQRVDSIEKATVRQWWLHGVQTLLLAGLGIAKKVGVI